MVHLFEIKNFLVQHIKGKQKLWSVIESIKSISFLISYYIFYKFKINKRKTSIKEINIELVNYCNLRCKFCALDHEKPKIRMDQGILKHFFDDFLKDVRFRSVKTIHLYNGGDALLHPQLKEILEIIKDYKKKTKSKGIAFPYITLLTNAIALNSKNAQIILNSEIINSIRFSMDGGSREKFEEIRAGAKWDVFIKNITEFCNLNKKLVKPIKTGIITLIEYHNKLSTDWMSSDFKKLLHMVDGYELRYAHNWKGDIELGELQTKKSYKIGCSMLMHQLVLLPNGDITVCCADLNSKGVIGNINKTSLFDIYNSPHRLNMLYKFTKGKKAEIELCKNCESF